MDVPGTGEPAVPRVAQPRAAGQSRTPPALAVLRATVEASPEGMVVVGRDGSMIARNRRFEQMWPIPADVVDSGSDAAALSSVLDKLEDPQAFLTRVRALYEGATGVSRDELHLRDGRVFDRHGSALHDSDGVYLGWAWYFRDVTVERSSSIDAGRMGALVSVAQALGDARDEPDVLDVVAGLGVAVLNAQGAALCLADPSTGRLRVLATDGFDDRSGPEVADHQHDSPLPLTAVAVGGPPLFLTDGAAVAERFLAAGRSAPAGGQGSAAVPLLAGDRRIGSLSVVFDRPHPWREEDRRLLEALAALTAQSLGRIAAQQAEHAAALAVRRIAETLQRSLLTAPPAIAGLQVAVRYQAASQDAQVGGDWHDSFQRTDGTLVLAIGDVAGHDNDAAALMAQCRNVLRGVAQTLTAPPAAMLTALDAALSALRVDLTATALLCHVTQPVDGLGALVAWSNAGHLPPVLVHPRDGIRLLRTAPDLMLGTQVDTDRADHAVFVEPGGTLVLYSDGLVERKREDLDDGLDRLLRVLADTPADDPEALCDLLLDRLGADADDDVALLAMRVG